MSQIIPIKILTMLISPVPLTLLHTQVPKVLLLLMAPLMVGSKLQTDLQQCNKLRHLQTNNQTLLAKLAMPATTLPQEGRAQHLSFQRGGRHSWWPGMPAAPYPAPPYPGPSFPTAYHPYQHGSASYLLHPAAAGGPSTLPPSTAQWGTVPAAELMNTTGVPMATLPDVYVVSPSLRNDILKGKDVNLAALLLPIRESTLVWV